MATGQLAARTSAVLRWASWSGGTLKSPGCTLAASYGFDSAGCALRQAGCSHARASPKDSGNSRPRQRTISAVMTKCFSRFRFEKTRWSRAGLPGGDRRIHFGKALNGRRSPRGTGDRPDIRSGFNVRRRSQPYHLKNRRQRRRNAGLQERQRPHVAEQAAMIRRMVRFALRRERRRLRQYGHTQQDEDNQELPVAVDLARHGSPAHVQFNLRTLKRLGYQMDTPRANRPGPGHGMPYLGRTPLIIPIPICVRKRSTACQPAGDRRLRSSSRPAFKAAIRCWFNSLDSFASGIVSAIRAAFSMSSDPFWTAASLAFTAPATCPYASRSDGAICALTGSCGPGDGPSTNPPRASW